MTNSELKKHVIGWRLTTALVLFSALITVATSAYQVYGNYRIDINGIEQRLVEIKNVHINEITSRLWTANVEDLHKVLEGLLSLSGISYLEVVEDNQVVASAGLRQRTSFVEEQFPLSYLYKGRQVVLGKLIVQATLVDVHQRIISQVVAILISNGIRTFLVVGFVLFLVYNMITRHLERISAYAENVDIGKANDPLRLQRQKNSKDREDELDHLVGAINTMQDRIDSSYLKLQESELRFRQLAENIDGVFWIGSADWKQIVYVSPAYKEVWGQEPEDLYRNAQSWFACVYAEDKLKVLDIIRSKSESDRSTPYSLEYRITNANGEVRWISARVFSIRGKSADAPRIAGFAEDITERKQADLRLSKSESRFRGLMEATTDGIIAVNKRGNIVVANAAAEAMFGYRAGELQQKPITTLMSAEYIQGHKRKFQSYWSAPRPLNRKAMDGISGLKRDGSAIPLEIGLTPLQMDNESVVVAMLHDASDKVQASKEREQLQKQLQQSQKMESIGQLTGGIAHDFNNLLSAILGYTQLSLSTLGNSADQELVQYLTEVEKAGCRARDLVAQMLAFSRQEESEMDETDLALIVKESTRMIRSVIPASISLSTEFDDELPAVLGNTVQLHQVLMNLIVNARDAMQGQGELHIQVRKTHEQDLNCSACRTSFSGDFVEVVVTDTGDGMPDAVVDKVFEPFFTTKEVGKGTGMGLSMVHGIVHSHGGHIVVTTSPQGTQFRLLFPLMVETQGERHDADGLPQIEQVRRPDSNTHVLVVDDEPAVATMLSKVLQKHGFQVTLSLDSQEALAKFSEQPAQFDVVITDQTMPGLSGADLSRQILKIRADMPIILCTGYSEDIDEQGAMEIGIKVFQHKPLDTSKLLSFIDSLTQRPDAA